jgi:20S proteasome alpha/beta subunit
VTLILAIRSREGIVLASDGQVTTDAAGQPTRQPARKLFDIGGRIAWGAAGSVGLQQTLMRELAALNGQVSEAVALRRRLASVVIPIQQQALRDYVPQPDSEPPDLACIFCWCDDERAWILSIPRTGGDHQFHSRYSAIGSGNIFADYAMASVAHLGTSELDLEQAKVVAHKAVADAIEVAAVYLGPPIQMYAITVEGAQQVPREEVEGGIGEAVDAWKARQRESLGALASGEAGSGASRRGTAARRRAPRANRSL